ncbi:hypothetical protein [Proteus mirabilis]|uniref:hypothetical protein n=1 Tax=Proteus mirabilis TaxID=584 RepID=UPI002554EB06|nr:hypothetical protein [Proteus mirabilis]MDL2094215.1 hypothetical protein [Proteus mirabilis]HEK0565201.1 hypothetical protein [Proteus mirabilis]HEK1958960.1 hypothetical protein [Proteus mirabilis]HEK2984417.1 hypothetical protein [Proteus mirabilis]HEK3024305.1 hypothetical protein [Proteus mirabilis]
MDKSRQQFEEAIKQLSDPSEFESKLKRANNGLNYADQYVDLMWISWQASRESLEIELPERKGICHNEYESGYFDGIDKCEDILIRSGVKIKDE